MGQWNVQQKNKDGTFTKIFKEEEEKKKTLSTTIYTFISSCLLLSLDVNNI